jgi:hypothetical protein
MDIPHNELVDFILQKLENYRLMNTVMRMSGQGVEFGEGAVQALEEVVKYIDEY